MRSVASKAADTTMDYTESAYIETDASPATDPPASHWGSDPTTAPPSQPPTEAEPDLHDKGENLDEFDEELSPEASANVFNKSLTKASTPGAQYQAYVLRWEWWLNLRHFADKNSLLRSCYHIATTYKNAIIDLQRYYPLRYLYYDTPEYEIGYLSHEVVFKYQIILELFHLMQRKFLDNQLRDFAKPTYMLYIYTNILYQSTDIIHLCNMMHEVERKYEHYHSKGPFAEDIKPKKGNKTISDREAALLEYKRKRMKKLKKEEKERKQRMKMIEKGQKIVFTKFTTTKRKRQWDLYYGWSIEYW